MVLPLHRSHIKYTGNKLIHAVASYALNALLTLTRILACVGYVEDTSHPHNLWSTLEDPTEVRLENSTSLELGEPNMH